MQQAANREFVTPTLPRDMPRTIVGLLRRAMSPERDERPSLADFIRELKWTRDHPVGWRRVTAAVLPGGKPTWVNCSPALGRARIVRLARPRRCSTRA
jgi:hypothetical protein